MTNTPARSWKNTSKKGINRVGYADADGLETVEAWECHPDCPVKELDRQSGVSSSTATGYNTAPSVNDNPTHITHNIKSGIHHGDTGTASRFFKNFAPCRFKYTAKASRKERELGLIGYIPCDKCGGLDTEYHLNDKGKKVKCVRNIHSTVKPVKLMEYLCILTRTPTGGTVFDPFMGSGTTGVACASTGRRFVGCENATEHNYFEIAKRRIEHAYAKGKK